MTFQPSLPIAGFAGWSFLTRTRETQQSAFNASPALNRETTHFLDRIGEIRTAEALVADRTLRKVALGAFGLQDDIDNIFFIRKVLEEGTLADDALANRLTDRRYFALAAAFDFGDNAVTNLETPGFAEGIVEAYQTQSFEVAIGEQNEDMRLALGFGRELDRINARALSADGAWFAVMGTPPLRRVFEVALGLPQSIGALDIDQQLNAFRDKATRVFDGSEITDFADTDIQDQIVRQFLLRSEIGTVSGIATSASAALTLLQSVAPPRLF